MSVAVELQGLAQDSSNPIANALEVLLSCAKPSNCQSIINQWVSFWVIQ